MPYLFSWSLHYVFEEGSKIGSLDLRKSGFFFLKNQERSPNLFLFFWFRTEKGLTASFLTQGHAPI
jgi:hypothetical protein